MQSIQRACELQTSINKRASQRRASQFISEPKASQPACVRTARTQEQAPARAKRAEATHSTRASGLAEPISELARLLPLFNRVNLGNLSAHRNHRFLKALNYLKFAIEKGKGKLTKN